MRKTTVAIAIFLYISTLILTAKAQTTASPIPNSQSSPNLIGQAIAVIGLVVFFSVIAFAGYKILRKWSSAQSD